MQNRGLEVVPGDWVLGGLPADVIGAAVGDPRFEAGPRARRILANSPTFPASPHSCAFIPATLHSRLATS